MDIMQKMMEGISESRNTTFSVNENIEAKLAELDKREAELDARAEKGGVIGSHEDNTIKRERKKIRMERKALQK